MNDMSQLEEAYGSTTAPQTEVGALLSAVPAANNAAAAPAEPVHRRGKRRDLPPPVRLQGPFESIDSKTDGVTERMTAVAEYLQKMGKRIDALASYKDLVLLHKSLHPGVSETRKLIEQVEQATTRIEAVLNIDLKRLRNEADAGAPAQAHADDARRLERLEWMLRGTLGVLVAQMIVMILWLLR